MKKLFPIVLIACVAFTACKENKSESVVPESFTDTRMEDSLLKTALIRQDGATTIVMMNTILYKDSTRLGLYDSLFQMYYTTQNVYGMADVGAIILGKIRPDDQEVMLGTAVALEATGSFKPALEIERKLLSVSNNQALRVEIAKNLYAQKDVQGALNELKWILDNRAVTDTIKVPQPRLESDKVQQVPLRAVAHYLTAEIHFDQKNTKDAIYHANLATEIDPMYDLAAGLLMDIKYNKKR